MTELILINKKKKKINCCDFAGPPHQKEKIKGNKKRVKYLKPYQGTKKAKEHGGHGDNGDLQDFEGSEKFWKRAWKINWRTNRDYPDCDPMETCFLSDSSKRTLAKALVWNKLAMSNKVIL